MSKSLTTIIIIVLLVIIGIVVFNKNNRVDTPTTTNETRVISETNPETEQPVTLSEQGPGTSVSSSLGVGLGTTKAFIVSGKNYSFTPSQIRVKKGDTVQITFKNSDGMHDLKIDAFNVATKKIASGQEETVTFVADKTGSFEYYCSVGTHKQMGMVGTLIVE